MRTSDRSSVLLLRAIALWDRLHGSSTLQGIALFVAVSLIALGASVFPSRERAPLADAERLALDLQMRWLREIHPRPLADDVVLIGTDEDTYRIFDEPVALWHQRFAPVLHALARARPRAVGVDFVLPERSFERIMPGSDMAMMRALLNLKRSTRLVYVQTVDSQGRIVPVQANYRSILTPENLGVDQHFRDPDSVSRRFARLRAEDGEEIPTLVSQMLRALGRPVDEGFIDYSLGAPLHHIPIHQIPDWDEARLREAFGGRVILVGSLVGFVDRWRLPTKLLAVDPGRPRDVRAGDPGEYFQPGVLIHLQALRSHLAGGLLHSPPAWLHWLLLAIAALAVFMRVRLRLTMLIAIAVPVVLVVLGMLLIVNARLVLPVASIIVVLWLALIGRGAVDAVQAILERLRLRQTFAGQVSPAVMEEMLAGGLSPGVSGQLAEVCVLFSDVRDFTTLSENMPPDVVTAVLQRYFDRMVKAVHRYDGTVDKFIGDGMMVLFGAPRKSQDPCGDAVKCALAMMDGLDALNGEFAREGLPTLTIGIGINYGTVTVGNIGSSERHNYSAIGDTVNVAARLEGLTKDLGRKILITESVVSRIGERFQFDPLGSHKVKGHSPVMVWGIRTVHATQPVAKAEV